jgi:hypothetical protein
MGLTSLVPTSLWITGRSAAMADALAGSGKTVIPEEHQNLKHCLYVNKALNTQLNYELYYNYDAKRHYI